ncbi:hypothetical protein RFF05_02825 [Bengtsoniella intestinalis]|uniref:hypothetical protein n=1 Tax=Bengtsoniella intestinalis TaxID=3073143 RepID=UPI00391F7A0C
MNTYTTTGDGFSACALAYLAVDAYGGTTLVAPEFKIFAYTDGSYADYYLSYDRVNIDNLSFTHADANTAYYYEVSTTGIPYDSIDLDASTITFAGEALDSPLTFTLSETQTSNPVGYIGGYHYSYTGQFGFRIANPYGDEITADTATLNFVFTNGQESATATVDLNNYGNASTKTFDDSYYPYYINGNSTNLVGSLDGKTIEDSLVFPIYESTSAEYTFYDATGALQTVIIDTTDNPEYDAIPIVEYSTTAPTTEDVIVTLTLSSDNAGYFVYDGTTYAANEPCAITMTENGDVTVAYWAATNTTNYATEYYLFPVTNIVDTSPTAYWNYAKNLNADGSIESIANQAIVTVSDDTWTLVDAVGDSLSYTFPLGSVAGEEYTFYYRVAEIPDMDLQTYTVTLPYDVKDTSATLGDDEVLLEDDTIADTHAPSVQLLAYGKIGGTAFVNTQKLYKYEETSTIDILGEATTVSINPALTNYGDGYTTYSNSTEFISALGWGSYYRFQVDATDNSSVKLIVKSSATIPTYDMESDTISGVTLTGNTLDVSANTSFYLYAVDSEGNYTAVPLTFTSVGEAPVPQMVKEIVDGAVRVYLVPDEAGYTFTNLTITNENATIGTGDIGAYGVCPYIDFAANGNYSLSYTYDYMGTADASGTLYVNVNELDSEAPVLGTITWSVNQGYTATNQQVTASLPFNETIAKVEADTLLTDYIETMISGSTVSVRYLQSYDATFTLRFYDASGNYTDVTMPAVTNIDRVFNAPSDETTVSGTTATITFTFDETAVCGKTGTQGEELSYNVTANGTYTYTFYDLAGNSVSASVTVDEDNLKPLELSYSLDSNGANPVSAGDLTLEVSDTSTIYVQANRDCNVRFNGKTAVALTANTWTALEIAIGDCTPFIYASDSLGYTVSASLIGITANDTTAPVVSVVSSEVTASLGDSDATILALLKANITATDNVTASSYLTGTGLTIAYDKPSTAGTVTVTYTVKDAAGNEATTTCDLTFTADPIIILDGSAISRESTVMVSKDDERKLSIYFNGEPFSLMYEAGIKTVAQVKIGSTDVIYNASDAQIITILDGADTGYYTFCAVTQSHNYFRFIVYVR